jgi:phage terminase large subunit-like protein
MAKRSTAYKTPSDAFTALTTGLRQAAMRPTIYGYQPMEKQMRFHTSAAKGRLFLGGNRSGKTVGGATESVMWLTGKHKWYKTPPPPVRGRCVSVDFVNGVEKIVRPEIAKWMPLSELRGGSWETAYDKELRTLHLENGSFIEFMSYDQSLEKFAGTSRHFVWFDEEPPHSIFNECLLRLVDTSGHWWITMTPINGMTWVYDTVYVAARTNPTLFVVETSIDDNLNLSASEVDQVISLMPTDEKEARRHGKFMAIGGLVYKDFNMECVLPPVVDSVYWPNMKKEWTHFRMMDHGFNNPTAWLFGCADTDGRIIIYDEIYVDHLVVKDVARLVHIKQRDLGIQPAYSVGDPSIVNSDPITGTSVHIEYANNGINIVPGNNDVDAGINLVAQRLKDKLLYVTRNCEMTIREFSKYRWATWATAKTRDDKNAKEEPHKKDDHAMDALRYGVASRPVMEGKVVEPTPMPDVLHATLARKAKADYDPYFLQKAESDTTEQDFNLGDEW